MSPSSWSDWTAATFSFRRGTDFVRDFTTGGRDPPPVLSVPQSSPSRYTGPKATLPRPLGPLSPNTDRIPRKEVQRLLTPPVETLLSGERKIRSFLPCNDTWTSNRDFPRRSTDQSCVSISLGPVGVGRGPPLQQGRDDGGRDRRGSQEERGQRLSSQEDSGTGPHSSSPLVNLYRRTLSTGKCRDTDSRRVSTTLPLCSGVTNERLESSQRESHCYIPY